MGRRDRAPFDFGVHDPKPLGLGLEERTVSVAINVVTQLAGPVDMGEMPRASEWAEGLASPDFFGFRRAASLATSQVDLMSPARKSR